MIVTSVFVLAIVGSAFAFKAKVGAFCILATTFTGSFDCTTYIKDVKISTSPLIGTQYWYYANWDGDGHACTTALNNLCLDLVRLTDD